MTKTDLLTLQLAASKLRTIRYHGDDPKLRAALNEIMPSELAMLSDLETPELETWRDVDNSCKTFEVSNYGRIRRFDCLIGFRIIAADVDQTVEILQDHAWRPIKIDRLVAAAFIDNPNDLPQVNHLDGDPSNNRVENLEWATRSENQQHAVATGLNAGPPIHCGVDNHNARLTPADVDFIRAHYIKGDPVYGMRALARRFGVDPTTISRIVNGKYHRD